MAPESENERLDRIREAQINSRDRNSGRPQQASSKSTSKSTNKSANKSSSSKQVVTQPKKQVIKVDRANTAENAIHDILVGAGLAAIPAVLAMILLPGGFKLLGLVILLVGAAVAYLRGETLA